MLNADENPSPQALSDPLACEAECSVFQQSLPYQTFDFYTLAFSYAGLVKHIV
jgi:hypothetical protein